MKFVFAHYIKCFYFSKYIVWTHAGKYVLFRSVFFISYKQKLTVLKWFFFSFYGQYARLQAYLRRLVQKATMWRECIRTGSTAAAPLCIHLLCVHSTVHLLCVHSTIHTVKSHYKIAVRITQLWETKNSLFTITWTAGERAQRSNHLCNLYRPDRAELQAPTRG